MTEQTLSRPSKKCLGPKGSIFYTDEHQYRIGEKFIPGLSYEFKRIGILKGMEHIPKFYADRGSAVHYLCELLDQGKLGEYDPSLWPYLNAYLKFLDEYKPDWELIEQPMISESLQLGSTLDRMGLICKNVIVDLKTSSQIASWHKMQLAIHSYTLQEITGQTLTGAVLQLKGDGTYIYKEFTLADLEKAFEKFTLKRKEFENE